MPVKNKLPSTVKSLLTVRFSVIVVLPLKVVIPPSVVLLLVKLFALESIIVTESNAVLVIVPEVIAALSIVALLIWGDVNVLNVSVCCAIVPTSSWLPLPAGNVNTFVTPAECGCAIMVCPWELSWQFNLSWPVTEEPSPLSVNRLVTFGASSVLSVSVCSATVPTSSWSAPAGNVNIFVTLAECGCAITVWPWELLEQFNTNLPLVPETPNTSVSYTHLTLPTIYSV